MEPQYSLERSAKCTSNERRWSAATSGTNEDDSTANSMNNEIYRGYRPTSIQGKFMHDSEILVGPRGPPPGAISSSGPNSGRSTGAGMSSSPQGYYVITPFMRSNDMGTVLINRGWVPRQFVIQKKEEQSKNQGWGWERPRDTVNVVGVASKTEQPKYFSPPHDKKNPKQLLWMDRKAIEQKTNTVGLSPLLITETSPSGANSNNNSGDNSGKYATTGNDKSMSNIYPIKPCNDTVGEFKVLPSTHAGYAFTWFGLSGAGILMTKRLITRGRG